MEENKWHKLHIINPLCRNDMRQKKCKHYFQMIKNFVLGEDFGSH